MNADPNIVLPVLRQAIAVEQKARSFYLEAANTVNKSKGAAMFRSLADEEARHEQVLWRQSDALAQGAGWILPASMNQGSIDLIALFFPEGGDPLPSSIPLDADDLDALLFALGLENNSLNLYYELAQSAHDPTGQRIFEYLAAEDRAHLDLLMLNHEYITRVGWRSQ
jgi:rubrerythrin